MPMTAADLEQVPAQDSKPSGEYRPRFDPRATENNPLLAYRVVYADPPWDYGGGCFAVKQIGGGAKAHYPTMKIDAICKLPLPRIAPDAVLFMWTTSPMVQKAFK